MTGENLLARARSFFIERGLAAFGGGGIEMRASGGGVCFTAGVSKPYCYGPMLWRGMPLVTLQQPRRMASPSSADTSIYYHREMSASARKEMANESNHRPYAFAREGVGAK